MLIGLKAVVHNNAHWAQSGSIRDRHDSSDQFCETWALRKADEDFQERTEMKMPRSMMEIKRIEKIGTE